MTSQDDLALLKQMYQRGEISDEQYDVLRRHVLWGTPLPQLMDEVPSSTAGPRRAPETPADRYPSSAAVGDPGRYGSPAEPPGRREPGRAAGRHAPDRPAAPGRPEPDRAAGQRAPDSPPAPGRHAPDQPPAPGRRGPGPGPADPGSAASSAIEPGRYGGSRSAAPTDGAHRSTPPRNGTYPSGPPESGRFGSPDITGYRSGSPDTSWPGSPAESGHWTGSPDAGRHSSGSPDGGGYPSGVHGDGRSGSPDADQLADGGRYSPGLGGSRPESGRPASYLLPAGAYPAADRERKEPAPDQPRSRRARREAGELSDADPPALSLPSASRPGGRRRASESPVLPADRDDSGALPPASRSGGRRRGPGPDADRTGPRTATVEPEDELGERRVRKERARDPADLPPAKPARRRRSLFAVLTSVVLALALVGAGVWWFTLRTTGVAPAAYATSMCGLVRDWQQEVDSRTDTLTRSISTETDLSQVKTQVGAYYATLTSRTARLQSAILDAGAVDGGAAYRNSFATVVGDQVRTFADLADRLNRLDPAAKATFRIQLQSLLTKPETVVGNVSSGLARPPAGTPPELRTAMSAEPTCAPYVG